LFQSAFHAGAQSLSFDNELARLRASRTAPTDRLVGLGHGTLCHRLQDVGVAAFRRGIYSIETRPVKKRLPTPFRTSRWSEPTDSGS
jgi:hypothetical protein